jgi:hypothetical protein
MSDTEGSTVVDKCKLAIRHVERYVNSTTRRKRADEEWRKYCHEKALLERLEDERDRRGW